MANKEATVYIVDVGKTMQEHGSGRPESNMDFALKYIWDKLTTTVATGRKTLLSGVIALRSEGTDNMLGEEDIYKHISVLHDLAQLEMPGLRHVQANLKAGSEQSGDVVSALIIAIQMIAEKCRKLAYTRRIILVTDSQAPINTDDLGQVTSKLLEDSIEVTVLGIDFDDAEVGYKEENKPKVKYENEQLLRQFCEDAKGVFGTLAEAVDELDIPRIKAVKPIASYKGVLTLGDPNTYSDAFTIDVERYPKTRIVTPPSATRFVVRSNLDATQSNNTPNDNHEGHTSELESIRNARTYKVVDESAPGGKREVDPEDLAKGYEYGRTAVHISESDQNVTTFETPAGLDIIGFVDSRQYERYLDMSATNLLLPQKGNDLASMALSSFIHALYELEYYAVARLVAKENNKLLVVLLCPCIEPDLECLYECELPFAEDLRQYKFPPLDQVLTVSGKSIKVHRNLPSDELQDAMNDLVDSMDLSTFAKDDEGKPAEYMQMDEVYSPVLHHLNTVIKHKAVYSDRDPPEPASILTKYSRPPDALVEKAQSAINRVIAAADVKKVPPRARGKRYSKREEKPLSALDVDALLASDPKRKQKRIDPANAVPEFKQFLGSANDVAEIHDYAKQLSKIIVDLVTHSVGETNYDRALELLGVLRTAMDELEEPAVYNDFMKDFKKQILTNELGGDRGDLWFLIRINKHIGLITQKECAPSTITDEDAIAFKSAKDLPVRSRD